MTIFVPMLLLALSPVAFPAVNRFSQRIGAIDHPGHRKIHQWAISRLGGLGIFLLISLGVLCAIRMNSDLSSWPLLTPLSFGLGATFLLGFVDDLVQLSSKLKLLLQILIAVTVFTFGFRLTSLNLGPGYVVDLGGFAAPVTVFWIVGVMNALNLIDGMDGLCGGVSAITFVMIGLFAHFFQNAPLVMLSAICASACLGFLLYNFHPARMFMGDSGSMTLGFLLATMTMAIEPGKVGSLPLYIPFLLLVFPLLDTTVAILRRTLRSFHIDPVAPHVAKRRRWLRAFKTILIADGDHIHHRLLKRGLGQRKVAVLLYSLSLSGSLVSLLMLHLPVPFSWIVGFSTLYGIYLLIGSLDYLEFSSSKERSEYLEKSEAELLQPRSKMVRKVS